MYLVNSEEVRSGLRTISTAAVLLYLYNFITDLLFIINNQPLPTYNKSTPGGLENM